MVGLEPAYSNLLNSIELNCVGVCERARRWDAEWLINLSILSPFLPKFLLYCSAVLPSTRMWSAVHSIPGMEWRNFYRRVSQSVQTRVNPAQFWFLNKCSHFVGVIIEVTSVQTAQMSSVKWISAVQSWPRILSLFIRIMFRLLWFVGNCHLMRHKMCLHQFMIFTTVQPVVCLSEGKYQWAGSDIDWICLVISRIPEKADKFA